MDHDKQNALISEALGFHTVTTEKKAWNNRGPVLLENVTVVTDKNGKKMYLWTEFTRASMSDPDFIRPKNYVGDLNHMRDAEKLFWKKDGELYEYWKVLCECCSASWDGNVNWWAAFASSEQRAEAFLKTIFKWDYKQN